MLARQQAARGTTPTEKSGTRCGERKHRTAYIRIDASAVAMRRDAGCSRGTALWWSGEDSNLGWAKRDQLIAR
jgi:hypothetical protein